MTTNHALFKLLTALIGCGHLLGQIFVGTQLAGPVLLRLLDGLCLMHLLLIGHNWPAHHSETRILHYMLLSLDGSDSSGDQLMPANFLILNQLGLRLLGIHRASIDSTEATTDSELIVLTVKCVRPQDIGS